MAATILTVGFMGLIQAVTMCSGMMDEARRQTLANQIINHEIEKMRLYSLSKLQLVADIDKVPINSTNNADSPFLTAIASSGAAYFLSRTSSYIDPNTNTSSASDTGISEYSITVTWIVTTSRRDGAGNLVTFTHSRSNSAYYGKYGLNLTDQRS